MANKEHDLGTIAGAYAALTDGGELDKNTMNTIAQFNRAFTQSRDQKLKDQIRKKLKF